MFIRGLEEGTITQNVGKNAKFLSGQRPSLLELVVTKCADELHS